MGPGASLLGMLARGVVMVGEYGRGRDETPARAEAKAEGESRSGVGSVRSYLSV